MVVLSFVLFAPKISTYRMIYKGADPGNSKYTFIMLLYPFFIEVGWRRACHSFEIANGAGQLEGGLAIKEWAKFL